MPMRQVKIHKGWASKKGDVPTEGKCEELKWLKRDKSGPLGKYGQRNAKDDY